MEDVKMEQKAEREAMHLKPKKGERTRTQTGKEGSALEPSKGVVLRIPYFALLSSRTVK
jgi:hypothetical protein